MRTRRTRTLALCSALAACLPSAGAPPGAPPMVVAVRPSTGVAPDAPVAIAVSVPLARAGSAEVSASGAGVPADVELGAGGYEIRLSPRERWPAPAALEVQLGEGFADADGRALAVPDGPLAFETAAPERARASVVLRAPSPARAAPPNLRTLTAAVLPRDFAVASVVLDSGTHRVQAEIEARSESGLLVATLPERAFPCAPLCPGADYALEIRGEDGAMMEPAPRIHTASTADLAPPAITSTIVRLIGHDLTVRIGTTEPARLRGRAASHGAPAIALVGPLVPSTWSDLTAAGALAPGEEYAVTIEGEDEAGNPLAPITFELSTPPAYAVAITEVVATPLHDWSGAEGADRAFDAVPGSGTVSDADEWIELVNLGPFAIDLEASGLVLRTLDATPAETLLARAPALLFGDGGGVAAWGPGEALVVHPRGAMAQREVTVEIAAGERVLDRLIFGAAVGADHAGGRPPDLLHEALARDAFGLVRWCAPTPGDPLPPADCAP